MHRRSRTPGVLGAGIAAALSLALAAPQALAEPAPAQAPAADPVPGLVAGQDTAAPQLVTGLSDPAPGAPADAARAHLAAHQDRYRIDPGQLDEVGTERAGDGRRTVRFQQRHGGIPVLGGQYLVHLTGDDAAQRVESAGGRYFTGLTAPTTPTVPDDVLRTAALGALADPAARAGATAEDGGLVILPGGAGRLARHFTVRPAGAADTPTVREVYVDATAGVVALAHDAGAPYVVPGATADPAPGATVTPATGTAPDAHGRTVPVNIGRLADGSYQLTDLTRPAAITTYDAAGRDYNDFGGRIPADVLPAHSAGPDFPAATGIDGVTDAHLNAAIVYDFYHDRLGRDGLDGKAGPIDSVVNVSAGGKVFPNAFWDGKKMIYGGGGPEKYPFSVALDVAGHEMTHGVIQHTANLAYLGQPGAMNEALADYFGNAIEVTARGIAMDDPKAALLGESLCRTGTPEACATRRLDDHRSTVDDYIGVGPDTDSAGVHLNSTIFGGALWDIRRTLDPLTADRLIYRALADYLTPLDDFVAGRNAVLAAGRAMGLGRAQLRTVADAFDAHGIRAGWQHRLGLDSRTLVRDITSNMAMPVAAGGHWVMLANSDPANTTKTALYTGSTSGSTTGGGAPVRLSPDDGRYHSWAATDGTSAAWLAVGWDAQKKFGWELLTAPLSGAGPVRSVYRSSDQQIANIQIAGGEIAYTTTGRDGGGTRIHLSHEGAPDTEIPLADGHGLGDLSLQGDTLAWTENWTAGTDYRMAPTAYSLAAGKVTAQYLPENPKDVASHTRLAGGRLYWMQSPADHTTGRSSIRSGALDGSGVTDVLPADSTAPEPGASLTVSDRAITYSSRSDKPAGGWSNAALPKLWQLPLTGGTPERVSCNRGGQSQPAADRGTRVVWLDATPGRTDLVTRERPAGAAQCDSASDPR
ncbi:M4 family metallopeptidase [Kitasatospora aureofaciens]|uniref:M4 family metallopeptidase n=1 Tax=Kitasatospora aureofaciens TaxID=1894 RepID=UPI001C44F09D|nr:M4 family metallopeptidase [Kitasatospora aureofaciens]MBV6699406.1 M4 family metallopeptidase [Kitasatospora aureofaciens]